jgi:repressor LexA
MLSRAQHKTLDFIRQFILRHGYAPSLAEIAAGLGLRSKGSLHKHVQALAKAGYLTVQAGQERGLRLTGQVEAQLHSLPLLGRIAAGRPIEAIQGEDTLNLVEFLLGPERFALRVQGDSMIEAGILDGDTVVIERRDTARNGDIVVALIDGEEATLKRLRHKGRDQIELLPANARLLPMVYPAERVRIQGVLVGQLRTYP